MKGWREGGSDGVIGVYRSDVEGRFDRGMEGRSLRGIWERDRGMEEGQE